MPRGVKKPRATLRKSRCSGGSISMIVSMRPIGPDARLATPIFCSRERIIGPSRLLKRWGLLETSMMSACFVSAQKLSNSPSSSQRWTGDSLRSSVQTSWGTPLVP
jgi:hypothetical protein